jgi:hypothetical protein
MQFQLAVVKLAVVDNCQTGRVSGIVSDMFDDLVKSHQAADVGAADVRAVLRLARRRIAGLPDQDDASRTLLRRMDAAIGLDGSAAASAASTNADTKMPPTLNGLEIVEIADDVSPRGNRKRKSDEIGLSLDSASAAAGTAVAAASEIETPPAAEKRRKPN